MKLHVKTIPLLITLCFTAGTFGQETLSISDAISRALDNNYDIRIVRYNQKITEMNDSWSAAGRFPSLNFDVSSNNQNNLNDEMDFTTNTVNPGVSMNWVLFDGFSIRIKKQKLEALSKISKGNTTLMVENTIQYVISAYYNTLLEKEKLKVLEEVKNLSKDRYDYTMTKREIGSAVTFDVLQAKNSWLEDKANFIFQEVMYKNAIRDLNYLMGVSEDVTYIFTEEFASPLKEYDADVMKAKMLENNNVLKNQYVNQMLLNKEIALAKSRYFPTLSLRSGADAFRIGTKYEGTDAVNRDSKNLFANVTLSYSLFDGGIRKRALNIAKIQDDIGEIETDEMKHSLTIQLSKIYELYNVRKDLFIVAEENLEAAKLNMQISKDKFRAGTINSFNYRDVQLIYLNAALNRLNAIYNLIDTDTALIRITGSIISEY